MQFLKIPAVILSGGQSRRMNHEDKAFLLLNNRPLLEISIERLFPQAHKIAINTNSYSSRYGDFGLPVLQDETKGFLGPLAGICTAMHWAKDLGYESVLTVAVDSPLFPQDLVAKLHKEMMSSGSDIVFAASFSKINKKVRLHPVFGLWNTQIVDDLLISIKNGVRKVLEWSATHKNSYVCFFNNSIDPFFNINTPDDLLLLKEVIEN